MTQGAPDYVHLRQILAKDALGNLVPVACDPSGRIILLPYGTQTVSQDDPTRTIQGADGLDLYTIAVDAAGRLIMLPYGWDGATYRPLKVDEEGRMIAVMKGQAYVMWGMRGWWKFVSTEETTIKDHTAYGNNGSAFSGVTPEAKYVDGVIGEAIELDGNDDYITIPDSNSLDIDGEMTIEFWLYRVAASGDPYEYLVYKDYNYMIFLATTGEIKFDYWASDGERYAHTSVYTIPTGSWIHLVVVLTNDPTVIILYINNEVKATSYEQSTVAVDYTYPLIISGNVAGNRQFEGYMDELRLYNRALSADEVAALYTDPSILDEKVTRIIAVDSEGRMEVNLKDLPYKDQVLERFQEICSPAGNYNLQSSVVPHGKLWVINVCNAYVDTAAIDTIDIGIYDGSDNFIVAYEYGTGLIGWVNIQTPLILKAGDRINAGYVAVGNNGVINLVLNGYELDAP